MNRHFFGKAIREAERSFFRRANRGVRRREGDPQKARRPKGAALCPREFGGDPMRKEEKAPQEQWKQDGSRVTMSTPHENRFAPPQPKA